MALELAKHNPVYEDIASKFFEVSQNIPSLTSKNAHCLVNVALHLHRRRHDLQGGRQRNQSMERSRWDVLRRHRIRTRKLDAVAGSQSRWADPFVRDVGLGAFSFE